MEKQLEVGSEDIVSILSAFDKLIILVSYKLTKADRRLVQKVVDMLNEQQRAVALNAYPEVMRQL